MKDTIRPQRPPDVSPATWAKALDLVARNRQRPFWPVWRELAVTRRMRTLLAHFYCLEDWHGGPRL